MLRKLSRTIVIAIGNLKGGMGKSVITRYLASFLHDNTDLSVLVVDADDDQMTIMSQRIRELNQMIAAGELSDEDDHESYDCVHIPSSEFGKKCENVLMDEYDIIFVDLPGNLKQEGVKTSYLLADMIFIPVDTSEDGIDSTVKYLSYMNEEILPRREKLGLNTTYKWFFNNVNIQLSEFKEYNESSQLESVLGIDRFKSVSRRSDVWFKRYVSTMGLDFYLDEKDTFPKWLNELFKEMLEEIGNFEESRVGENIKVGS